MISMCSASQPSSRAITLGDPEREALLAEQRVAAVAGAEDQISRVSGKWTMYFSSLHGQGRVSFGAPTLCRQGTKSPSSPRTSSAPLPMRVMIRMRVATYAESVIWTPISAISDPSGPMPNGTTYIVWPRMEPRNFSVSSSRISCGSRQLLVGPASSSFSEQM